MVFDTGTNAPYFLNRCTNDFTYIPDFGKITDGEIVDISYGRSGVVERNGLEFVFNIGDVLLNGETIKFIKRADTIAVNSIEELNASLRSDTLSLNSQSELIFSDYYYVVNADYADSLLSNEFNVNFRCELVKLTTGEVVGVFEQVTYNKNNTEKYGTQGYLVNCLGIEAGNYCLRLTTTVNEEVNLSLSDIQLDEVVLEKSNLVEKNFKGEDIPLEYALDQNYPNPFNPSTKIRYQIPEDGIVALKVYDILGSEVVTLVNDEKPAGKYEISFDASSLASGVYIYRLQAGEFVNVKKMLLLK
ncbi:MAG: T9SS type A sorting domain-containing protein [Ignavibacteria bacterium]|nr:T9SS type A sorting domain-containing protein [Ignavibacteria bacterium]MBT8382910.1 T9SS type A sorting domain-containing protein [Ignavibacteria bacterium]MBT8392714.1 T9SS type A sorting domain-containing protein [Ignavibacteria bacterium]NNJ53256.1 T9SS type A sorting domain-containing protein [Ignavibacteriaceae bacterium]NNL20130.1 T9SS type A sorting domain-containing protein [Ignavibacteriaceae bacterium]